MRDQEWYIEQGCFHDDCGLLLCWRNSNLLVKDRKAARLPAIMAAFAATFVRSPTSMDAPFCMTHVLTVVCSMCVLRMSFSTSFHRPSATSRSGTQVSITLETDMPRSAVEAVGLQAADKASSAMALCHRGCWMAWMAPTRPDLECVSRSKSAIICVHRLDLGPASTGAGQRVTGDTVLTRG